jgi:hypothetical protein
LIAVFILPALAANLQLLRHAAGLVNRPYMIHLDQPGSTLTPESP